MPFSDIVIGLNYEAQIKDVLKMQATGHPFETFIRNAQTIRKQCVKRPKVPLTVAAKVFVDVLDQFNIRYLDFSDLANRTHAIATATKLNFNVTFKNRKKN